MRFAYVKAGKVVNVVEHDEERPAPEFGPDGEDVIPDPGLSNVGDVLDVTPALLERRYSRIDAVILKECFRLTNEVKALQGQAPSTAAQYKARIKGLL